MNRQAVNPYLPSWEYIPDGEPHVFNGRVYVYGSHDRFNAPIFCVNDYVCWSAPVEDLSEWRYEGVIYRKKQDPKNPLGYHLLFAPDVCQGPDGRYYLYYAFDFLGIMSVAVCDTPAGEYKFLGHIHYADGTLWGRRRGDQLPFDPGVLADDDGRVWLYSGFYNAVPAILTGGHKLRCDGGTVLELEKDMVTIKTEPRVIFPKKGPGAFQGHEFFEASSIRKEGKTYIFVYSSRHNHELCYATSQSPDRGFSYGGTLVSQGDIFLDSNLSEKHAAKYLGNTHGGLLKLEDKWYVFYHRQTNRHSYSRQACAEKLRRNENGAFLQAEVTSCGLNDGPLKGKGRYEARIACNLWGKNGTGRYDGPFPKWRLRNHPYFTQDGPDREDSGNQYIANMRDGAVAGFKYFAFKDAAEIKVHCTGSANGRLQVSTAPDFSMLCADIFIKNGSQMGEKVTLTIPDGTYPLYFRFTGIPGSQGQRVYAADGVACTQAAQSGGWGGKTGLYFIDMNVDPVITDTARCITAKQDAGISWHRAERSGVMVEGAPRAVNSPDKAVTRQNGRRMKEPNEEMFTLTAQDRHGIFHRGWIRKLTPRECWRLQGFTDEQFEKATRRKISDSQLYKMAGNSVTVTVIAAIGSRIREAAYKYHMIC